MLKVWPKLKGFYFSPISLRSSAYFLFILMDVSLELINGSVQQLKCFACSTNTSECINELNPLRHLNSQLLWISSLSAGLLPWLVLSTIMRNVCVCVCANIWMYDVHLVRMYIINIERWPCFQLQSITNKLGNNLHLILFTL